MLLVEEMKALAKMKQRSQDSALSSMDIQEFMDLFPFHVRKNSTQQYLLELFRSSAAKVLWFERRLCC